MKAPITSQTSRRRFLGLSAAVLAGVGLSTACRATGGDGTGGTSSSSAGASMIKGSANEPVDQPVARNVFPSAMKVVEGPEGNYHDAFVPAHLVVKTGIPVYLTVTNYSQESHSIDAPELNVHFQVKPAATNADGRVAPSVMDVMFMPVTAGIYRWTCEMPC